MDVHTDTQRAKRILVVDDERSMRTTIAANLELEGFDVVEAESGEQAMDLVMKEPFDLVLSDIRMPGIHGVELFRRARKVCPDLPFVLMSAFALEQLVDQAIQEGVFTVLTKPFDVEALASLLLRAVRKSVVLVVDDVERDAVAMVEALAAAGLRARAAFDAEGALQAVRSGDVDVCIVDLVIPHVSGAVVAEQIRSLDPTIAIIAISGYAVPELMGRVAAKGAFSCMRKPFAPRQLIDTIARARGRPPASS